MLYCLLGFYALMSIIAFICYGRDKQLARRHKWRTPEKVLLGLGFFGGSIGAIAGMRYFRHKTKHWYFWCINILGLVWQMAAIILIHQRSLL